VPKPSNDQMALDLYMSDYVTGSNLLRTMSARAQARFRQIMAQLKEDTAFELTETEYFNMAKRLYFCEQIETQIELDGADKVRESTLVLYNSIQESMLQVMRRYRDGRVNTKNSIEGLQRAVVELMGPEGTLKLEYNKGKVIDAVVRKVSTGEDNGLREGVLDPDPVRHPQGHHAEVDGPPPDEQG